MQTPLLFHAIGFSMGFFWVCHQIGIDISKVLKALTGGFALSLAGIWGAKFFTHEELAHHLAFLPVAGLLGATLILWLQSREQLAQKISRDSVFLLTLTFIYFFSPFQGAFRVIGLLSAAPCVLVLVFCLYKKEIDETGRVGLMFWAMLVSLVIGIQQIVASPEALAPVKNAAGGFSSGSYLLTAALQAAGLVTLVFSLIPFIDWVRGQALGIPIAAEHEMVDESFTFGRALTLTLVHGVPLLLNWKFQYFSYETMVGYALVWSPILSSTIANSLAPEPPAEIPGWDNDTSQAS